MSTQRLTTTNTFNKDGGTAEKYRLYSSAFVYYLTLVIVLVDYRIGGWVLEYSGSSYGLF